jgi:hypothetical protein
MPIFDTKIANFKTHMKHINRSKMVFTATIEAAENEEYQYFNWVLKKCHYL